MSRVTVLMAVFDGERYIRKAIDSVLCQTLRDIQLICIDDASNDSTPGILAEYARKDPRVKIITHTTNTGQAVARNDGIAVADGDYITMVDADDWISPDALEKAAAALDSDKRMGCVLLDLHCVYPDREALYPMRTDKHLWTGMEAFELSLDWSVHGLYVALAGLFREYPYDTSCRLYSDDNTTRLHYLHSGVVGFCDGIYYYRQRPDSMTNAESIRRYDLLEANTSMMRQLRSERLPDTVLARFERERWINLTGISIYWMEHEGRIGTKPENALLKARLKAVYDDVDRNLLPLTLKCKFGYMPCTNFERYLSAVRKYNNVRNLLKRSR